MYSTHKTTTLVASLLLAAAAFITPGCAVKDNTPPEAANTTPMPTDNAMARRDWPMMALKYDQTGVPVWQTRYYLEPKSKWKDEQLIIFEPILFGIQTVALPVAVLVDPPFERPVLARGQTLVPDYSAAPPLAPDYPYDTPPTSQPYTPAPTVPYNTSPTPANIR